MVTIYGVKKTTVYLDADLDRAIGRLAQRRGISKAEVIRQALRDATRSVRRPKIRAIGVGRGPGDVADDIDRHLADTGFGG